MINGCRLGNMETCRNIFLFLCIGLFQNVRADFEHLVSQPQSIILPEGYDTTMSCEMNIIPDNFQWKFYPSNEPYNSQPKILLNSSTFHMVPHHQYTSEKQQSALTLQVRPENAGDYQCLAYYGASVVASVPWRITLAKMGPIQYQDSVSMTVQTGNIVSWRCNLPESTPTAFVDYMTNDKYISPILEGIPGRSMIIAKVTPKDSGSYQCVVTNTFEKQNVNATLTLRVTDNAPASMPNFISKPMKEYTALKGSTLFLECAAVGKPVPRVEWSKRHSNTHGGEVIPGGLLFRNMSAKHSGVYYCNHTNPYGSIIHEMLVVYQEEPSVECFITATTVLNEGTKKEVDCQVKGTPEPDLAWFLNGFSVLNDSSIKTVGSKICFNPIEKRHAGHLQLFASNIAKTVYYSLPLHVLPLSMNGSHPKSPPRHEGRKGTRRPSKKGSKLEPPSRPTVSRVNDETVVVRWNMSNNHNLVFFRVQYAEVQKTGKKTTKTLEWNTSNDIPAGLRTFEVGNLQPEHSYKFRVASVSSDDFKMSGISKKFHLTRLDFDQRNPLPVCLITHAETINETAIKIYWDCPEFNETIDGFYVNYNVATRAGDDYMLSTVEGNDVRSVIIGYLQPETSYDIKLQSFNQKMAGENSPLMKGKTAASRPIETTTSATVNTPMQTSNGDTNIYIIIAVVFIVFACIITAVILLFVCRKWHRNKLPDNQDKTTAEHHIQADANDYVVESKTLPRSNGCSLPGNRITITSNPLADTDKNPTVIELRNFANNNVQSGDQRQPDREQPQRRSAHRKNVRGSGGEDCSTGSNYV